MTAGHGMGCRIWMTRLFKARPRYREPAGKSPPPRTHTHAGEATFEPRKDLERRQGFKGGRGLRSRGNVEAPLDSPRGSPLSRGASWPKGAPPTHGAAAQRRAPPRVVHSVEKSGHHGEASTEPPSDRLEVVVVSVHSQEGGHLRAVNWVEARAHHPISWSRHLPPAKPPFSENPREVPYKV